MGKTGGLGGVGHGLAQLGGERGREVMTARTGKPCLTPGGVSTATFLAREFRRQAAARTVRSSSSIVGTLVHAFSLSSYSRAIQPE